MSPINPKHLLCHFLEISLPILKDHVCATEGLCFSALQPPPFVHREVTEAVTSSQDP